MSTSTTTRRSHPGPRWRRCSSAGSTRFPTGPRSCAAPSVAPVPELELAIPGEHNRLNAGVRARRARCGGGGPVGRRGRAARVSRRRPALPARRGGRRRAGLRRLRPPSGGGGGDAGSGSHCGRERAGCWPSSSRTSTRGRATSHGSSRPRSRPPTMRSSATSTRRVRSRSPGVTGKLVAERLSELRPGLPVGWAPRLEDAAALAAGRARGGDIVLTIGAGDVDRAGPMILELLGG